VLEQACDRAAGITRETLDALTEDEQLRLLLDWMKVVNLLPRNADVALLRGIVNTFLVNTTTAYTPTGGFDGPALLLNARVRATHDTQTAEQAAGMWSGNLPQLVCRVIEGNHMSMLKSPGIDAVGEAIMLAMHARPRP
jgi:thioesterase domain-containing protein